MLYELLVHCIPPSLILSVRKNTGRTARGSADGARDQTLAKRLVLRIDDAEKAEVIHCAAQFVRVLMHAGTVRP
jgi:hypothetical protein